MINVTELRKKIEDKGMKLKFIAEKLGISYFGFLKKLNCETEFKVSEIQILCELLHLTSEERDSIFFTQAVDKKSTN